MKRVIEQGTDEGATRIRIETPPQAPSEINSIVKCRKNIKQPCWVKGVSGKGTLRPLRIVLTGGRVADAMDMGGRLGSCQNFGG